LLIQESFGCKFLKPLVDASDFKSIQPKEKGMTKINRLVLDVLKPKEPKIVDFTTSISEMEGIEGVNTTLIEVDEKVRNLKVTVEGEINEEKVRQKIDDLGGSVHSVDEVAAGEKLVEESSTLQD
jgi:hypothetical protein